MRRILAIASLSLLTVAPLMGQGKLGLGVASAHGGGDGLSATFRLGPGVANVIANSSATITGRYFHPLGTKGNFRLFAYGLATSGADFGGGVSATIDWRALSSDLPELWWNFDFGASLAGGEYNGVGIGLGVHYYF